MKNVATIVSLTLLLICTVAFRPQDGFTDVRCGADVPKALIGRHMGNERVVVIENRHKNLGLKDLGASDISDKLNLGSWMICGDEYMLLEDSHYVVRDVLKFPDHSKKSPEFIGGCQVNATKMSGTIVAVLNDEEGVANLSAKAAWKIDEKTLKFVKLSTEGLRCPRDGIITADGGH